MEHDGDASTDPGKPLSHNEIGDGTADATSPAMRIFLWGAVVLLLTTSTARARSGEERFRVSGAAYTAAVHQPVHLRWKTFTDLLHTLPASNPLRDNAAPAA